MKREIEKLKSSYFDVLIIGGGIHGATIAHEASNYGLKTCLIEKNDFGSATSANSLKVIHGGLRYLQHGNIKRMRESIYSRKVFQQIAPHLIENIPFVIPTKGNSVKSRLALSIAMTLNDIISWDRNKNILNNCFIPKGKTISKKEISKIIPNLNDKKITGGAVWFESIATNTERLLFEFLHKANDNGAILANYIESIKYNYKNDQIISVEVIDKLTQEKFKIQSKIIVNAVGPWLNEVLSGSEDLKFLESPLTKAVNIIVKGNLFKKYAVGLESIKEFNDKAAIIKKGKRLFFFVPLEKHTMIGTTYTVFNSSADECKVTDEDINEIINEVNSAYHGFNLKKQDVTQIHVGAQAMPKIEFENEFDIQPETHSLIFDHNKKGKIRNLISIKSVKYTTAPFIAKEVSKILLRRTHVEKRQNINFPVKPNYVERKKSFFELNKDFNLTLLNRLWRIYGIRSDKVIEYISKSKQLLFEKEEVYLGELIYCYENEMAIKVDDIISRRLGLNSLEKVSEDYYNKLENLISDNQINIVSN